MRLPCTLVASSKLQPPLCAAPLPAPLRLACPLRLAQRRLSPAWPGCVAWRRLQRTCLASRMDRRLAQLVQRLRRSWPTQAQCLCPLLATVEDRRL